MCKKKKQQQKFKNENNGDNQEELLPPTFEDFMSKEDSNLFYTISGCEGFCEWNADWPQIQSLLTSHLVFPSSSSLQTESAGAPPRDVKSEKVSILVPGCGNSRLSEHLYDAGFKNITNVDFSEVVISHMMKRNVRKRPRMKWRVMDMTSMQFANETFDAIIDKAGLDLLMEPRLGPRLGNLYMSEVKRLLKAGGKYICVTLAEPNVLGLIFPKFRFGWKMNLYATAENLVSTGYLHQQVFMVVTEKLVSTVVSQISIFPDEYSIESRGYQAEELYEALEKEKWIRTGYSNASDVFYPLEDLILGAKENLTELKPGRRVELILGERGVSRFLYNCILFDAQRDSEPFSHQFLVYVIPNTHNFKWILSLSKGPWSIVEGSNTARLLMVVLDSRHSNAHKEDIQKDLSPLVKKLVPGDCDGVETPFVVARDGTKLREIVHQVTSALRGLIVVDEVIYEKSTDHRFPANKDVMVRRLTIQNLVQAQARLSREGPIEISSEVDKKKLQATSKTRKKGKHRKCHSHSSGSHVSSGAMKVRHNHLADPHHNAVISGLMLFSVHLKGSTSEEGLVKTMVTGPDPLFQFKTVVIGLRAGLLPMFMNNCLPSLQIEVVELDPVLLDVARAYFDFEEDERLKVHITDGIKFVREKLADSDAVHADGTDSPKVDMLIVDVDSPYPTSGSLSGLLSPAADFVEASFLLTVKNSLSEQGLLSINLVSRSSDVRSAVCSRLKMVFSNLFTLQLEEDVSEVIFALKTDSPINEDHLSAACNVLATSLELRKQEWSPKIIKDSKLIKSLRYEESKLGNYLENCEISVSNVSNAARDGLSSDYDSRTASPKG